MCLSGSGEPFEGFAEVLLVAPVEGRGWDEVEGQVWEPVGNRQVGNKMGENDTDTSCHSHRARHEPDLVHTAAPC